jgi:hypothetical protein
MIGKREKFVTKDCAGVRVGALQPGCCHIQVWLDSTKEVFLCKEPKNSSNFSLDSVS